MNVLGKGVLLAMGIAGAAGGAVAQGKSIIVLDASGSMWGQIDGRAKLEIARQALGDVLGTIPAETSLGLMAYGHREKGSCSDIELVVPSASGTGPAILAAAKAMTFLGKTPLTEAVRQAAAELRSTEEKATVILITDGIETCEADPSALGTELEASGVDFTAHVVGFGLTAEEGRQVACLAQNTGGTYIEAKDTGSMTQALQTTVAAAPAPEPAAAPAPEPPKPAILETNLTPRIVMAAGGEPVGEDFRGSVEVYQITATGTRGDVVKQQYGIDSMLIAPGDYILAVDRDLAAAEVRVSLTADKMTIAEVNLNAGELTIRPLTEAGGDVVSNASVDLDGPSGATISHCGDDTRVLLAGSYGVTVSIGKGKATATAVVEAGKSTSVDVIVAVGLAVIDTYYTEDIVMEDIGQAVDIFEAKTALDGSRTSAGGSYGAAQNFTLPPGEYIAVVQKDAASAEVSFTVKGNERTEVRAVLNAGVLAATATGAKSIEVFKARKDLQGNRTSMWFAYGDAINLTFPPGDYIIDAEVDGAVLSSRATVAPGERTEITIP